MIFPMDEDLIGILNEIGEVEDLEEQGYLTAPHLAKLLEVSPKKLLLSVLRRDHAARSNSDNMRDIGVIRWCLENRGGL